MYHFIRKNLETYQKDSCPVCIAQNYSQNTQSGDEFNWLYHADLSSKQKITLSIKKKDETKHENFCKILICPARMPMGAIICFKHIIFSFQFHISETGLQFVPSLKKNQQILNTKI